MPAPVIGRRHRFPPGPCKIDRTNPIASRLCNVFWGAPQVSALGFESLTPANRGSFGWTAMGPGVRGVGVDTTNAMRVWPLGTDETPRSDLRPFTMFAVVHIDSTSERGALVGMVAPGTDSGAHIGIGSGTFDSLGNEFICLHGNQAWKASGQNIGTGTHTIGCADTSAGVEFYVDGRRIASIGASNCESGAQFTALAQNTGGATPRSLTTGVVVAMGAAWYRALTASEFAALHADPYRMLRF